MKADVSESFATSKQGPYRLVVLVAHGFGGGLQCSGLGLLQHPQPVSFRRLLHKQVVHAAGEAAHLQVRREQAPEGPCHQSCCLVPIQFLHACAAAKGSTAMKLIMHV